MWFKGKRSRNKASVGEPADGSLNKYKNINIYFFIIIIVIWIILYEQWIFWYYYILEGRSELRK